MQKIYINGKPAKAEDLARLALNLKKGKDKIVQTTLTKAGNLSIKTMA